MSNVVQIGQQILHPPLRFTGRELIAGVFSGTGDLTKPGLIPPFDHVAAWGITWSFFSVPAPFGYRVGTPRRYYELMIQLSTIHTDLDGHELVSDQFDAYAEGIYWLWREPAPLRVHYEIVPGVQVVFEWLTFPIGP